MVFAKTSKAAARLSKQIKDNKFTKKYLAVVHGILEKKENTLVNYLKKDENNNSLITNEKDGKYAKLHYKVLKESKDYSVLDILLETGRHHQIRVQLKNIGHPLYGDQRYGLNDKKQLGLFAYHLEFYHPVTKEKLIFEYMPKEEIFKWKNIKEYY